MTQVATVEHAPPPAERALPSNTFTPAMLLQMAVEKGAEIERLQQLMELRDRWEAGEARKAYYEDMAAFKAEHIEIFKNKQVSFNDTNYKHAELSDVCDAIIPALARHRLMHRWDIRQEGSVISVTCTISHALGHSESVTMQSAPDESGKKNKIQSVASANTYLQRYTLLAATGLSTKSVKDDDGHGYGEDFITAEQLAHLEKLIADYGVDREKLLAYAELENLALMPASSYKLALVAVSAACKEKKAKAQPKAAEKASA